ncbi:MAG: thiamine pyrophosphate-binding protein [Alphaproteobacteria bacterium]
MPRMTGARFLAEALAAYGTTHVFMVPAILRRTMAEMERRTSIARIHAHGEKAAAYMADGYARASGRPGLCMAQHVGGLNLAAGLRDAWLAHAPVIAFTGGCRPADEFRKVYQEADNFPTFAPVTKWNARVEDAARFPDMVRQAFRVATSGCPGPVHLQFRGNEGQVDVEEAEIDVIIDRDFAAVPPFRPLPEPARLQAAVERIARAARPVIVAGGGVRHSGAGAALRAFAEATGIPVATSLNGKDAIPGAHPLSVGVVGTYARRAANRVVAEADLVIFIGTEAGSMTTHFWTLPPKGTAAIQIDIDPESLGRAYPLEVAILGDARVTLEALSTLVNAKDAAKREDWRARVKGIGDSWRQEWAALLTSDAVPIRPERICADLTRLLPEDALVVVDTGHAGMWMGGMFDLRSTRQDYIRCAGHLGWAFPAGIGAKCARPERPVFVFTGDLGIWYHIAEIETAVRWNIKTVTLVNNNHSGSQSTMGFHRAYEGDPSEKSRELWVHKEVNFARIAEDIGAFGVRVERPGELGAAIEQAFGSDRPALIDVATDIEALAPTAG